MVIMIKQWKVLSNAYVQNRLGDYGQGKDGHRTRTHGWSRTEELCGEKGGRLLLQKGQRGRTSRKKRGISKALEKGANRGKGKGTIDSLQGRHGGGRVPKKLEGRGKHESCSVTTSSYSGQAGGGFGKKSTKKTMGGSSFAVNLSEGVGGKQKTYTYGKLRRKRQRSWIDC